jgi:hypothetical protein
MLSGCSCRALGRSRRDFTVTLHYQCLQAAREGLERRVQTLERELADLKAQKAALQQKNVLLEIGKGALTKPDPMPTSEVSFLLVKDCSVSAQRTGL